MKYFSQIVELIIWDNYQNEYNNNLMIRTIVLIIFSIACGRCTLIVTNPIVTDFPNNEINYYYSNFGEIPYEKTLSFDINVLNDSLCDDPAKYEHLIKPTYIVIKTNFMNTCSYTKRALVAQAIGAKGIIIASPSVQYAKGNVVDADDGNGKKVHITCLFITNQSFDRLDKLSKIQIIANFPIPHQKVSTLSLFLSASKRNTYVFLRQFKQEYKYLKDHVKIEPIYHTMNCPNCSPNDCYLDKYCCYDYGAMHQQGVGQKIIRQQMHQYAIFNQRGTEKWLQYMNLFDQYCNADWNNIDQCTSNILKKLNMDDGYLANPLQILAEWRLKQVKIGFVSFPEAAINNMIYGGNFQSSEIVDTLCSSLQMPPKYCLNKNIVEEQVSKTNNHVIQILLVSITSLLLLTSIGICLYKKFIKSELTRDMSSRVNQLVANYANTVSSQKKRKRQKLVQTFDEEL